MDCWMGLPGIRPGAPVSSDFFSSDLLESNSNECGETQNDHKEAQHNHNNEKGMQNDHK